MGADGGRLRRGGEAGEDAAEHDDEEYDENDDEEYDEVANTVVDMLESEAMLRVRVSYGLAVNELKNISKCYKEAKMALEVGSIFHSGMNVLSYENLGIGRLIYQLPVNLCKIFVKEVFGDTKPEDIDEETITTINKFFENNLNVSETSRQLYIHRNTEEMDNIYFSLLRNRKTLHRHLYRGNNHHLPYLSNKRVH